MNFAQWQQLAPPQAAREIHQRMRNRLPPAQQRAAIAWLGSEDALTAEFTAARHDTPMGGMPFLAKDIFDVRGIPTLGGSTFLPEVRPTRPVDGAFVQAVRATGAVLVGKTHLHEFAYGVTGENPNYGD